MFVCPSLNNSFIKTCRYTRDMPQKTGLRQNTPHKRHSCTIMIREIKIIGVLLKDSPWPSGLQPTLKPTAWWPTSHFATWAFFKMVDIINHTLSFFFLLFLVRKRNDQKKNRTKSPSMNRTRLPMTGCHNQQFFGYSRNPNPKYNWLTASHLS